MNSRDRIIAALKHEETDRIPVDLGATESSGITWIAYNNLKKYLGINTETKVYDLAQLIVLVEEEVLKIIGADAVPLIIGPRKWKDWEFEKGEKVAIPEKANLVKLENGDTVIVSPDGKTLSRLPKGGYYFDTVFHPLEKANSLQDIRGAMRFLETFDWPGYCDEDYADLRIKAEKLYEEHGEVDSLYGHALLLNFSGKEARAASILKKAVKGAPFIAQVLQLYLQKFDFWKGLGSFKYGDAPPQLHHVNAIVSAWNEMSADITDRQMYYDFESAYYYCNLSAPLWLKYEGSPSLLQKAMDAA